MYQVHSGTRPGRPVVMIVLCGLSLAATLGLAWMQTQAALRLGPTVRVDGVLEVRPPVGWTQDPCNPSRFLEAVLVADNLQVERSIKFSYQRRPEVPNLFEAVQARLPNFSLVNALDPAPIGRLSGIQVVGERQIRFGRRVQTGKVIYRLAHTPQGHEVLIEYLPVREVTPGDLALLEQICAAVRVDDDILDTVVDEERVGLSVPEVPSTRRWPGDWPAMPAMYLEGVSNEVPIWTLGLYRTWLGGQTPEALLKARLGADMPVEYRRKDIGDRVVLGARVASGRRFYLVSDAPERTVLLELAHGQDYKDLAVGIVEQLVEDLQFTRDFPLAVEDASENGARMVARLAEPDRLRTWAGKKHTEFFVEHRGQQQGGLILQRGPKPPVLFGVVEREHGSNLERMYWEMNTDGQAYQLEWKRGRLNRRPSYELEQSREAGSDLVATRLVTSQRRDRFTFDVESNYLCRPLDYRAAHWVSQQEGGNWIVTMNRLGQEGTFERLFQPLPPTEERTRVLVIDAQRPTGRILEFSESGDLLRDFGRNAQRTAVTPELYKSIVQGG